MTKRKFTAAVCQMDSRDDREANLEQAAELIRAAAEKGADLAAFPETVSFIGRGYSHQAEPVPGALTDFFCAQARERGLWLVSGSFPEADPSGKPKNTMVLIDPEGNIRAKYSKLHMFDVEIQNGPTYMESARNTAGDSIVLADTPFGRLGFAICYDLRFDEMFRVMALNGAQVIVLPSSFTMNTGKDHWEPLLRARAIENGVYIVAPAQIGQKTGMNAYGKSMIVDPWGDVIARAGDRVCCVTAEIDLDYLETVRAQVPSLRNRREDVYAVSSDRLKIYEIPGKNS